MTRKIRLYKDLVLKLDLKKNEELSIIPIRGLAFGGREPPILKIIIRKRLTKQKKR